MNKLTIGILLHLQIWSGASFTKVLRIFLNLILSAILRIFLRIALKFLEFIKNYVASNSLRILRIILRI